MKFLRTFEQEQNNYDTLELGDYVLCEEELEDRYPEDAICEQFTASHVGKFIKIDLNNNYIIEYDYDIPEVLVDYFIDGNCRQMYRHEVMFWSKDYLKVDIRIKSNKFNL
jgi:hypothetical protein